MQNGGIYMVGKSNVIMLLHKH